MYLSYYNLKKKPFQTTTNPNYFWHGDKYKAALEYLNKGVAENERALLLTGDTGLGKTTLVNYLINSLDDEIIVCPILNPLLESMDFYRAIGNAFSIEKEFSGKEDFISEVKFFLTIAHSQKKKALLVIDEAHLLDLELLQDISALLDLAGESTPLQVLFVAQKEFEVTLRDPSASWLDEKIKVRYRLEPFTEEETAEYIRYQLMQAGATRDIFGTSAIQKIFVYSGGYPRVINNICDLALVDGYGEGADFIDSSVIRECGEKLIFPNEGSEKKKAKKKQKIKEKAAKRRNKISKSTGEQKDRSGLLIGGTVFTSFLVLFLTGAGYLYMTGYFDNKLPEITSNVNDSANEAEQVAPAFISSETEQKADVNNTPQEFDPSVQKEGYETEPSLPEPPLREAEEVAAPAVQQIEIQPIDVIPEEIKPEFEIVQNTEPAEPPIAEYLPQVEPEEENIIAESNIPQEQDNSIPESDPVESEQPEYKPLPVINPTTNKITPEPSVEPDTSHQEAVTVVNEPSSSDVVTQTAVETDFPVVAEIIMPEVASEAPVIAEDDVSDAASEKSQKVEQERDSQDSPTVEINSSKSKTPEKEESEENMSARQLSQRSYEHLSRKEFDKAIYYATVAIHKNPKLVSPYVNRSWAYVIKKEYEKAIKDGNVALQLDPENSFAYNNRGLAFELSGRTEEALSDYKIACEMGVEVSCNNQKDLFEEGRISRMTAQGRKNLEQGKLDAAFELAYDVLQEEPDNKDAKDIRSRALSGMNIHQKAQEWTQKSYEHLLKKDFTAVIKTASIAIEINSELTSPYINRAWAYSETGMYDKAIEDCNIVLTLDRNNVLALNNKGLAFERSGRLELARAEYKAACDLGLGVGCSNFKLLEGE